MSRIDDEIDFEALTAEEHKALTMLAGPWNGAAQYEAIREGVVTVANPRPGMGAGLSLSPLLAWATVARGLAAVQGQRLPGGYGQYEHQFATLIVFFDAGFHDHVGAHLPLALAAGVRLEAIEAVWHDRPESLTNPERELVDYVRQVVAGTSTDAIFACMRQRMSDRAIVEFTALILNVLISLRTVQALAGGSGVSRTEVEAMLHQAREGTLPQGRIDAYSDWYFDPDRAIRIDPFRS